LYVDLLISTDVLSEGQNLQDCAIIVNYDLPWAIIRLIQRAGRVDRIGQQADTILCYSFLPADGVERIIRLRSRVRQRLLQNAEVVGTDEEFFDQSIQAYNQRNPGEPFRSTGTLTEYVAGIETVKSLQMEPRLEGRYDEMLAQYLAAGFDAAYYLYPYPYHRLVLRHVIRWTAGTAPPIEVAAPMCVHATVMRQTTGGANRLVVHPFNDANTTGGHALPVDDVPLREEVLPIADLRVTFRPDYRLRRVTLQPEGKAVETTATPAGRMVTVPRLEVHTLVVAELE